MDLKEQYKIFVQKAVHDRIKHAVIMVKGYTRAVNWQRENKVAILYEIVWKLVILEKEISMKDHP